jgi:hypothetical protein
VCIRRTIFHARRMAEIRAAGAALQNPLPMKPRQ